MNRNINKIGINFSDFLVRMSTVDTFYAFYSFPPGIHIHRLHGYFRNNLKSPYRRKL